MTHDTNFQIVEPPVFTIDILLLTILFFIGVSAVIAGVIGASPVVLIGGIILLVLGVYLSSLAKAKKLPQIMMAGIKIPARANKQSTTTTKHKFAINQDCILVDDKGDHKVKITHHIVDDDESRYRVEVLSDSTAQVVYCTEDQLRELNEEQVSTTV